MTGLVDSNTPVSVTLTLAEWESFLGQAFTRIDENGNKIKRSKQRYPDCMLLALTARTRAKRQICNFFGADN